MNHPNVCLNLNFLEAIQCAYLELNILEDNNISISNYNSSLLNLLNITQSNIKNGSNIIDLICTEDKTQLEEILYSDFFKEEKIETHFRIEVEEKFKWIKANLLIENSSQFNKKIHMFLTDISIIKQAQIETDKLSAQLSMVVDNTDSIIVQFTLDKELNINYNYISKGLQKIYGLDPKKVMKNPDLKLEKVYSEDYPMIYKILQNAHSELKDCDLKYRIIVNKKIKWLHAKLNFFNLSEEISVWNAVIVDISEQKNTEIEKDKLSDQLSMVVDNTDSVVLQFTLDDELNTKFLYINNGIKTMFGINPKELYKSPELLISRVYPEDLDFVISAKKKLISENKDCDLKHRIIVNGVIKWIHVKAKVIVAEKHLTKINAIMLDITKQKNIENEKNKLSEQLSLLVDNTDSVILQFKLDEELNAKFLYISNGLQAMYGLNPKDVYEDPKFIYKTIHLEDVVLVKERHQKLFLDHKDCELKYRIIVDGVLKWVLVKAKVIEVEKDLITVNAIILDVTKQFELELQAEKQSSFLKAIAANMDGAVYEFYQNSKGDFSVPYMSDGIYQLYDFYPEDVYRDVQTLFRIICPDHLNKVIQDVQFSYKHNKNFHSEFRVIINGKYKWISTRSKIQKFEDDSASWHGVLLDITKQKELEISKERIADQLKIAADNIDGVLYQFKRDLSGIYSMTYISDGVKSIYGISTKSIYEDVNCLFDKIHKDDIQKVAKSIEESYQNNKNWDCQYRIVVNGKIKWIQGRSKIKNFGHQETVWHGVLLDITKQKEIETKLKEQYEFFILLAKESNTIFGVYEMSGELSYISPNAEKLLGYSIAELKRDPNMFIFKEDKKEVKEAVQEIVSGSCEHKVYTHRYQKKDNSIGLLSVSLLLINTDEGRKIALTARDITQLKKLETDLEETTKKYKLFVEHSELKILSVDLDYKVKHITGTFPDFKKEDLIGKNLKILHSKKAWKSIVEPKYQQAISTKETIVYENSFMRNEKQEFYVEFVTPIIKNNKVQSLLLATKQITHQKKLEKDNQMLLREVHHRVKNNLQIIMSLIDIQLDQTTDNSISNIFSELKLRIKAISYVHSKLVITNNVGALSISEYSNTMIDQIEALYNTDKATVKITREFETHQINIENAVRFGLLLTEIVSNCFKHAFDENKENASIDIKLVTSNKNIIFNVKDNGIGFPIEMLTNMKSSSFGLQFIQGLVKSLEGSISIQNVSGAEVSCVFPKKYLFELDHINLKSES